MASLICSVVGSLDQRALVTLPLHVHCPEKPQVLTDFSLKGIKHRPGLPNRPVGFVGEGEH